MRKLIVIAALASLGGPVMAKIPPTTPVPKIDPKKLPPANKLKIPKGGVLNLTVATITWSHIGTVSQTAADAYEFTSNTGGKFTASTALDPSLGTFEPAAMTVVRSTQAFCSGHKPAASFTPWYPAPVVATAQGGSLVATVPIATEEFQLATKCNGGQPESAVVTLTATATAKNGSTVVDTITVTAAHFQE